MFLLHTILVTAFLATDIVRCYNKTKYDQEYPQGHRIDKRHVTYPSNDLEMYEANTNNMENEHSDILVKAYFNDNSKSSSSEKMTKQNIQRDEDNVTPAWRSSKFEDQDETQAEIKLENDDKNFSVDIEDKQNFDTSTPQDYVDSNNIMLRDLQTKSQPTEDSQEIINNFTDDTVTMKNKVLKKNYTDKVKKVPVKVIRLSNINRKKRKKHKKYLKLRKDHLDNVILKKVTPKIKINKHFQNKQKVNQEHEQKVNVKFVKNKSQKKMPEKRNKKSNKKKKKNKNTKQKKSNIKKTNYVQQDETLVQKIKNNLTPLIKELITKERQTKNKYTPEALATNIDDITESLNLVNIKKQDEFDEETQVLDMESSTPITNELDDTENQMDYQNPQTDDVTPLSHKYTTNIYDENVEIENAENAIDGDNNFTNIDNGNNIYNANNIYGGNNIDHGNNINGGLEDGFNDFEDIEEIEVASNVASPKKTSKKAKGKFHQIIGLLREGLRDTINKILGGT